MNTYLERYAYTPLLLPTPPRPNTGLIIVIPVFNEKDIIKALNSLLNSTLPVVNTEVLIIINQSVDCDDAITNKNSLTHQEVNKWIANNPKKGIQFHVAKIGLPKKHAGVGLARKAGMDEAVRRFYEIANPKGVILCYDADCTCSSTYIEEVHNAFKQQQLIGASINFKHELASLNPEQKEGIIQYELHLRYYVNGLRKAGYPYAFHTIGSSMAVRCDAYVKAGGMNRRKAGEDFHFLHKIIPYGNYEEISTATVYPSARVSDRVPFGTGKAMGQWAETNENSLVSYDPIIFKEIAALLLLVPQFYTCADNNKLLQSLPIGIQAYLQKENFENSIKEIKRQSSSIKTFIHRWFGWLNGLRVLHLVHYLRDEHYPSMAVKKGAAQLVNQPSLTTLELLNHYRQLDINFTADQISLKRLYSEFR